MPRSLSPLAIALGLGGLIPFLVCGYAAVSFDEWRPLASLLPPDRALFALVAYGASILSFLGAVHWGFSIGGSPPARIGGRADAVRLGGGVLPALIGWAALLVAVPLRAPLGATILLAIGFALVLAAERRAGKGGLVPARYLGLRWVLTTVVLLVLLGVLVMREARIQL